jgi:hypothetical protein
MCEVIDIVLKLVSDSHFSAGSFAVINIKPVSNLPFLTHGGFCLR